MERHANHALSPMACPHALGEVDLFGPGAAEHWYVGYAILHDQAPVVRLPGQGMTADRDAYILTRYADISRVVRDWDRFPPTLSLLVVQIEQSGRMAREMPDIDAMVQSIVALRPNPRTVACAPPATDRSVGRTRRETP